MSSSRSCSLWLQSSGDLRDEKLIAEWLNTKAAKMVSYLEARLATEFNPDGTAKS